MNQLAFNIRRFVFEEEGASAVEYGVLVALIIVAVITIVYAVGQNLQAAFVKVKDCLKTPSSC